MSRNLLNIDGSAWNRIIGPMATRFECACQTEACAPFGSISWTQPKAAPAGKRSDEQAAYFGLTRAQAVTLGKVAKDFTAQALAQPFTIQTRWRKVYGSPRYYAMVYTATGEDLAALLVKDGLARIYGTKTPLPNGQTSRQYLNGLAIVERMARNKRIRRLAVSLEMASYEKLARAGEM